MKAKQTGFTLIELMFTIVVLAVLLGIGVPNFRDFVRNSRMSSAANDLVTDFNLARSESVKRRVPVTLCKSQNGTSCDTDNTAQFRQWIVFVDDVDPAVTEATDGNATVDTVSGVQEEILRVTVIPNSLTARSGSNIGAGWRIVFRPNGFPDNGLANTVTRLLLCDSRGNVVAVGGNSAARGILLSATGRPAVTRDRTQIGNLVTALGSCP
jgi:type IV fimbrial biogenesis protein FimT